jgi:hypothetical protein
MEVDYKPPVSSLNNCRHCSGAQLLSYNTDTKGSCQDVMLTSYRKFLLFELYF